MNIEFDKALYQMYLISVQMAAIRHKDAVYGGLPYTKHLQDVENVLRRFGFENDFVFRSAAWLHDIMEDTDTTYEEVVSISCLDVADLVHAVTDEKGNRKKRQEGLFKRLNTFPKAIPLKLADRIANQEWSILTNRQLLKMYINEYDGFKTNVKYIDGDFNAAPMWEHLDYLEHVGRFILTSANSTGG